MDTVKGTVNYGYARICYDSLDLSVVSYSYITTTSVISVLLHKTESAARGRV